MWAEFVPSTLTSPSVVLMSLKLIDALALLSTRLVAITPPTARPGPSPPLAVAVLSTLAWITALSLALTDRDPASTVARSM